MVFVEFVHGYFREKAQVAHVDAQDRYAVPAGQIGRVQQRAVSAQHYQQIHRWFRCIQVACGNALPLQPCGQFDAFPLGIRTVWPDVDADEFQVHRPSSRERRLASRTAAITRARKAPCSRV